KLLAEVCLAAKYEGESITLNYPKYQTTYGSFPFELCTVLARSFADIGDIVRGKDLYGGGGRGKGKEKLEKNLKNIFEKIHEKLDSKAQTYYNDDKENYSKLREDWWNANRHTVWKAITCGTHEGDTYFRTTCDINNKKGPSVAKDHCRCNGDKPKADNPNTDPPTYFDYVPQYLRWFEEWAEDFCRKKKKYVDIVKTYCRGPNGKDKYCSRNGFDCEKTKPAIGKLRYGKQCTKCFFACYPYVDWIENQRKQFLKQRGEYENVINGTSSSSRTRRSARGATTTNYDGYESKFYNILKEREYRTVNAFLGLLNKEKACTAVNDDKGGKINFKNVHGDAGGTAVSGGTSGSASGTNDKQKGTFYRSDYCQPCPDCGVKHEGNGWKNKSEQCRIKLYEPTSDATPTDNTILKSGDGPTEIVEKLDAFCNQTSGSSVVAGGSGYCGGTNNSDKGPSLCEPWKCYEGKHVKKVGQDEDDPEYENDVKGAGGLCILQNTNKKSQKEPDQFQKTYNDFFNFWVAHMLKDSIHWRTEKIKKCLEKKNGNTCKKNNCKDNCDCFQKWITQKKNEWEKIKEHFNTQDGFDSEG
ncbi:hypothetical protein PFTANZ_05817, partial [Plasmodium falciparum Tanzania (2000708)]